MLAQNMKGLGNNKKGIGKGLRQTSGMQGGGDRGEDHSSRNQAYIDIKEIGEHGPY